MKLLQKELFRNKKPQKAKITLLTPNHFTT
jgi:hypothetical protein